MSSEILECAEQTATTNQADLLESVPESSEATTTMSPGARGLMKLQPPSIRGLALSSGKTMSFWAGLSIQLSLAGRATSPLGSLHLPIWKSIIPIFVSFAIRTALGPGLSKEKSERPYRSPAFNQSLLSAGGRGRAQFPGFY